MRLFLNEACSLAEKLFTDINVRLSCLRKKITMVALQFWILENDDVTCNPRIYWYIDWGTLLENLIFHWYCGPRMGVQDWNNVVHQVYHCFDCLKFRVFSSSYVSLLLSLLAMNSINFKVGLNQAPGHNHESTNSPLLGTAFILQACKLF